MTITAQYSGRCGSCDELIYPGDLIELADTGAVYVHADCGDAGPERITTVCGTCYLETPCGCEDDS